MIARLLNASIPLGLLLVWLAGGAVGYFGAALWLHATRIKRRNQKILRRLREEHEWFEAVAHDGKKVS